MRTGGKSIVKSSHDLLLIVGAVIAIAMIVATMVHNWRNLPTNMGANDASASLMVADNRLAPR